MIKLLHSADWHLDTPFTGRSNALWLKEQLLSIPGRIADLARRENCNLLLLSGDLFDGPPSPRSIRALKEALGSLSIPVCIAPGNHDFASGNSPWLSESWPSHVHIFTAPAIQSLSFPELDCRVYGAGFPSMDCPGLLEGFRAEQPERYSIGVFHGDPTNLRSPYCPITLPQIRDSGLTYLALGHIHKSGQLKAGSTLCAWPGCPMGRGYDEQGPHGVLITELGEECHSRFVPLDLPEFHRISVAAGADPLEALNAVLPAVGNLHFYQITLTGEAEPPDLKALEEALARFPNLQLRDATLPPLDLWAGAGEDSLEGVFFGSLRTALEEGREDRDRVLLAARISRLLLSGREVELP